MKLVKTTLFSAFTTFVRISSGFVSGKVIALFTGPEGVSVIGTFTNFISIVYTFGSGAINNGVIKYIAQHKNDNEQLKLITSTSLRISIYCGLITGCIIFFLAKYFSNLIFNSYDYDYPIKVLGICLSFYSVNALFISILNGLNQIKILTIANTCGSLFGLIFTFCLVYFYRISGALYSLVLSQSVVLLVTLFLLRKTFWFKSEYFSNKIDRNLAKKLGGFTLMTLISILVIPVSQIILRNMITSKIGIVASGSWQGMMRISDGYLMIITTSLGTYYLPKLSSLKTNIELKKEIINGYKIVLPTVLLGCLLIYKIRFLLIKILYTNEFVEMEKLFLWQLVGDFFKIAAWMLAYIMIAKAMTKLFIITEIIFSFLYVVLGYYMVNKYNIEGISIAFALNYVIYFITMIGVFWNLLNHKIIQ